MKKIILLPIIYGILLVGCKKSTKNDENEETKTTKINEVEYTSNDVKILLDTTLPQANATWDTVINADDAKMSDIKRLLDEISYCEGVDEKKLKTLYDYFETVRAMRYNQDNINGDLIDAYDYAQDKLITETNALAESTPNIEAHPLAIELIDDIIKADGMTFSKRGDYDICAKKINNVLKQYPHLVQKLGTPYSNYKKLGIFGFEDE